MSFLEEFYENIYEPWYIEYVAYKPIYDGLHKICEQGEWTSKDEEDFESVIRLEGGKVDLFIKRKQRELESKIAYCERLLYQKNLDEIRRASIDDTLTDVLADINELSRFTRINFKALQDLVHEHDTLTHTSLQPVLIEISRIRPLDNQRFDDILVKVSSLLDLCRDRLGPTTETIIPIETDENKLISARYWVHQDHITEVKALLLFNLPMYINNPVQEFVQTEHSTSAVYFDNNQFSEYSSRLQRDDGAEIIDFRWFGDMKLSNTIFIERRRFIKTEYGGRSVQDSIIMDEDRVVDFIEQKYTAELYADDLKKQHQDKDYVNSCYITAKSIQESISKKHLEPKLRVYYTQLRFESPHNKTLSITLDNNIAFAREDGARLSHREWRRTDININYPFSVLRHDLYLFPYAILETQITDGEVPLWLSRLTNSNLVYEVPRFSAFLHGIAYFWGPQLPLLPWWIPHMNIDIRTAKKRNKNIREFSGLTRSKSFKPLIDGQYRIGYLETQLGRKESRRLKISNYQKDQSIHSTLSLLDSTDKKKKVEIEYLSVNDGSSLRPSSSINSSSSRTRLRSRYPANTGNTFLDTYYSGREGQSQAYMVQDINTIKRTDELKKVAMEKMEEEEEENKKKKKKKKVKGYRMEPKIFFANERTFIHWLQFAAIILTAALTLLNFGDTISTISGITFFCIAFVITLYAFFRYRYRAHQMSTRPHVRYDDLYGPAGLCFLFIGALIVKYIFFILFFM